MHWRPGTRHFNKFLTLVLNGESLTHFRNTYLPDLKPEQAMRPETSLFHADLQGLRLLPTLMTCGAEDCLLEDSIFMACKWMMAGGHAVLQLYSGSPHRFILFTLRSRGHPDSSERRCSIKHRPRKARALCSSESKGPGSTMFAT